MIDGSKALRAGVERVFGEQVEVQRGQIHKRRNVKEYLPENCQYAVSNYAEAKEVAENLPETGTNQSEAGRSLEEGLEETLVAGRLTVPNMRAAAIN